MASIRRLLSLAANKVDEEAAFWTEERLCKLAKELIAVGIETGIELRLGFPELDTIAAEVDSLCKELDSERDLPRLRTLLVALASSNWVPFEARGAPILNQAFSKKRYWCAC